MLKRVGASGQLMLGKKYSGRHFEVEERANGELVLRPARLELNKAALGRTRALRAPAFQIAEVEQLIMPTRDHRNTGAK